MLEKIVKFAKISPGSILGGSLGALVTILTSLNGVDTKDIPSIAIGGVVIGLSVINGVWALNLYKKVSEMIENNGFDSVVKYERSRNYARIYAEEFGLMEEYETALKRIKK